MNIFKKLFGHQDTTRTTTVTQYPMGASRPTPRLKKQKVQKVGTGYDFRGIPKDQLLIAFLIGNHTNEQALLKAAENICFALDPSYVQGKADMAGAKLKSLLDETGDTASEVIALEQERAERDSQFWHDQADDAMLRYEAANAVYRMVAKCDYVRPIKGIKRAVVNTKSRVDQLADDMGVQV